LTEKCIIYSLTISNLFAGRSCVVDTVVGSVFAVLREVGRCCLVLEDPNGWLLIKNWASIKRRLPDLRPRFCRDCEEATVHQTGSQLWVSCRLVDGWRPINSQCVLAEKKGEQ